MCNPSDYDNLQMDNEHRSYITNELELWHRVYLPPDGVRGKEVLDLGAGCGETAQFYLLHGAKRVISVECDPSCLEMLRRNFGNDSRVTIVASKIGHVKMDIEGGEKNMILETHFLPYFRDCGFVGRASGGPANVWQVGSHERMSRLNAWLHMKRIAYAHMIRMFIKGL